MIILLIVLKYLFFKCGLIMLDKLDLEIVKYVLLVFIFINLKFVLFIN